MAVELFEGFDTYNGVGANTGLQARWSFNGGTGPGSLATGRFGGQCVVAASSANDRTIRVTLPSASASKSVGFALRMTVTPPSANAHIFALMSSTTAMVGLFVATDGSLSAARYTSATANTVLGAAPAGTIILNQWHYIEVEVTISDTVGVFKVYVDGVQVLNLTAQDTRNGTPTTVDTLVLGLPTLNNAGTFNWDDVYVTDTATKLGERRVETLYPTSDVAQGFARSTGSTNYTLVDEAQVNGDTDYVQGSTVGDTDTYGLGDLSSTPTTIDAVQLTAFAEKTDAGSRSIALQAKSGATTSDGSNYALAASYGKFQRLLTTDPNTAAAWGASGVNALQGGPKVTV